MRPILLALSLAMLSLLPACGGESVASSQTADASTDVIPGADASTDVIPGADASTVVPATGQHILFEHFRWSGWGGSAGTLQGVFITDKGEVFTWKDSYEPGKPVPDTKVFAGMTEAQLSAKHGSNPHLVTTVNSATLLQKFAMIGAARQGTLLSQTSCADFGDDRFYGYLYDQETSTYTPVLLGVAGDQSVLNTAPEGPALMQWIGLVAGETGEFSCAYKVSDCSKPLCPGVSTCGENHVPVANDGETCASNCGAPSACREVPSCSSCNDYAPTCVIDQFGKRHCLASYAGCESLDKISCACAGEQLCAGGADLCRGDLASGFSCAVSQ